MITTAQIKGDLHAFEEHGVVASAQPQTAVESATTEMVDVLEIDVPEVE